MTQRSRQLLGLILMAALLGCCQGSGSTVAIQIRGGEALQVKVEVADTAEERAQGLMFRESLAEGAGMLFLFPEETQGSFWMKNTPISLDLIFIREGHVVSIIENAVPYSTELLTPDSSYTMVLEVPGGYAARHDVRAADAVMVSE